jgi:GNAT superfamily N-acetyltransferase
VTVSGLAAGLVEDAWLGAALERPVYALAGDPGAELPSGFVYAKAEAEDVERARRLQAAGFYLVDTNVTLERAPGAASAPTAAAEVAEARADQADELLRIAGSCFRYSRFHLDPGFERHEADRVKREWIRSHLDGGRGLELLAASVDGRTAGFLAVLDAGDARVVDLVGVAPDLQGRGIGHALVAAFVGRHGDRLLRVGTQVANAPSLRLYAAHGFVPVSARYVFHRHS